MSSSNLDTPKSSSLTRPIGCDQYVARLQVAMYHQLPVRTGNGLAHFDEQPQSCVHVVAPVAAIRLQGFTVDPFQHQASTDVRCGKCFDEFRDARIIKTTQRALLVVRKLRVVDLIETRPQNLEGHDLIGIERTRRVDLAHAAATDQTLDPVVADRFALAPAQPFALRGDAGGRVCASEAASLASRGSARRCRQPRSSMLSVSRCIASSRADGSSEARSAT